MELGHHLSLIDRLGVFLPPALLASLALRRFAVVALSGDPPLARAFASAAHVDLLIMRFSVVGLRPRRSSEASVDGWQDGRPSTKGSVIAARLSMRSP
jgi:hypothetical protein